MSNQNNSNNKTNNLYLLAACAGIIASAVSGLVVSRFDLQTLPGNAATPNSNSLDVIVGQVDTGAAIELSVCLKTDPTNTNLHITDASSNFTFNPATLTPSPTILAAGNFGGNGVSSSSYAPLLWKNVIGTADRWSMDITYTGGTGTLLTINPDLVGKVQFAKVGNATGTVTAGVQEFFSVETTTGPMIANVINYNGLCTAYSSNVATTSSSLISSSQMSSSVAGSSLSSSSIASSSSTISPLIGVPNPIFSNIGNIGSSAQTIYLTGNTFTDGTPATFTPAGATTAITGKIQGGNFVPDTNQIIPAGALSGLQNGTLKVSGQSLLVPTSYSTPPPANNTSGGTINIGTTNNATPSNPSNTPLQISTQNDLTVSTFDNIAKKEVSSISTKSQTATATLNPNLQSDVDNAIVRTGGMDAKTILIISLFALTIMVTYYKTYKNQTSYKLDRNLKAK
jgi:hypothetical protein